MRKSFSFQHRPTQKFSVGLTHIEQSLSESYNYSPNSNNRNMNNEEPPRDNEESEEVRELTEDLEMSSLEGDYTRASKKVFFLAQNHIQSTQKTHSKIARALRARFQI